MSRKSEILAELARSRAAIARDTSSVRAQLDVTAKVKSSVRSRPFVWLGGATILGYILAGPKTRTKTVTKVVRGNSEAAVKLESKKSLGFWGVVFSLIKLVVPLARPALSAYAAKRFADFAGKLGQ